MRKKQKKPVVEVIGSWASLVGDPRLVSTPTESLFAPDGRGFEDWFCCIECEMGFQFKEMILTIDHRFVRVGDEDYLGDIWCCPGFPVCNGSLLDAWPWKDSLKSTGDGWLPDDPVRGVCFPMYPARSS